MIIPKQKKLEFLRQLTLKLAAPVNEGKPVVYLAGKVTGLPTEAVQSKFNYWKNIMEQNGYVVLNPVEFMETDEAWPTAMRMAATMLMMADAICLLPDWEDSMGAKMEFEMATRFCISAIA